MYIIPLEEEKREKKDIHYTIYNIHIEKRQRVVLNQSETRILTSSNYYGLQIAAYASLLNICITLISFPTTKRFISQNLF